MHAVCQRVQVSWPVPVSHPRVRRTACRIVPEPYWQVPEQSGRYPDAHITEGRVNSWGETSPFTAVMPTHVTRNSSVTDSEAAPHLFQPDAFARSRPPSNRSSFGQRRQTSEQGQAWMSRDAFSCIRSANRLTASRRTLSGGGANQRDLSKTQGGPSWMAPESWLRFANQPFAA